MTSLVCRVGKKSEVREKPASTPIRRAVYVSTGVPEHGHS